MRPRSSPEGTWTRQTRPVASYKHTWHLKLAQEGLIELQEGSKLTPGWLKMVQDGSKMVPRSLKTGPSWPKTGPRWLPEGNNMAQMSACFLLQNTHKNHWCLRGSGASGAAKRGQEALLKALGHARHVQVPLTITLGTSSWLNKAS